MALVKINGVDKEAKFTVKQYVESAGSLNRIVVTGVLTLEEYIPEINTIESERYFIDGVRVYEEHFGSDDKDIVYVFDADSIKVKK